MPAEVRASTMPAAAPDSALHSDLSGSPWLLIGAIFFVALIPLFATPVLPFIDFYNHMARYFILANIDSNSLLQQNYQTNWTILPNIGIDIIVTGLMKLLPYPVIPRLTVILIFAVQYCGVLYFNRALTGRLSALVALLVVPLLYSFILNWGFANFLLGLGLVFCAAGWWLTWRHRLAVALPVACLFAVAIFFVHGLTFALYGVLVAMLEIGLFLQRREKRIVDLVLAMLPLLVQAILPVVFFLVAKTSKSTEGLTNADDAVTRLSNAGRLGQRLWELFEHRLMTIARVAEGPSLAFDAITLVLMLALLALLLRKGSIAITATTWPALLAASLLVVVMPPAMFGIGYVADRMPLFLALLLVGSLKVQSHGDTLERRAFVAIALLVAVRLGGIALDWRDYGRDYADFNRVAAALPRGALVETIVVGAQRLDYARRRCQMYGPLLITEHGAIGRVFANEAQQPLVMSGPLLVAIQASPRPDTRLSTQPGYYDDAVDAAAHSPFPWLLLCDADRLGRALPDTVVPVTTSGRFTLARLSHPGSRR